MARSSKYNQKYRKNASRGHKLVGDLLKEITATRHMKIYQEYPVRDINPHYPRYAHKVDWVIKDIKLAIEFHGQQHSKPVRFGGISEQEAKNRLLLQRRRDHKVQDAITDAGWSTLVIYEDEILDGEILTQKILAAVSKQESRTYEYKPKPKTKPRNPRLDKEYYEQLKERARVARRRYYRKIKALKAARDREADEDKQHQQGSSPSSDEEV